MRILHIYKDYYPVLGGIENHIKVLAEAQAAAGHAVTVLVCATGGRTEVRALHGVEIWKAGRLTTVASMPISLRQPLALLGMNPDLVHVHSPYPLGEVSSWLLKHRKPVIIRYHSDVVRQQGWLRTYGPLLRQVLAHATRILVSSPRYLETSPWLQPVRDRCEVVPLSVDLARFSPPEHAYGGPPTLLFVGRLRYYKGLDTLLQAMVHLPREVKLRVVGTGEMDAPWRALVGDLGILDRVRFEGDVSDADLPEAYRQASLFVLPANARAEAFGLVLLEAMASGLPCVTTEVGTGTSWIVQEGVTGRVVPPQDPEAMAGAIAGLLADPGKLDEMGRAARTRAEDEFSQGRMVKREMAVYRSVS